MFSKVINRLKKYSQKKKYTKQIFVQSSSIQKGIHMRFDVEPEERIYVKVGSKCIISANFIFESKAGKVTIGDNVHLGGINFICREEIIVENDVTMAWDITIYDHNSHSVFWTYRKNDNAQCYLDYQEFGNNVVRKDWSQVQSKPIRIGTKAWVGFGVTILKGVTIGEGAVVGAKSVVTKDVPPWTVVAGNPAREIKYIPENMRQ